MFRSQSFWEAVGTAIGALLIVFLVLVVLSIFTALLWNWLMPTIFGLPVITYWQALGLSLLFKLLIPHSSSSSKK